MGLHARRYLAGLDTDWKETVARWTLGVGNALEKCVTLPFFPMGEPHLPRGTGPALESDRGAA